LYAFKQPKNEQRIRQAIKKQFQFINTDDPDYTEEQAATYRTIDMAQLLAQASSRGLITEQEAAEMSKLDADKRRKILA